jgi:hypothetical protein
MPRGFRAHRRLDPISMANIAGYRGDRSQFTNFISSGQVTAFPGPGPGWAPLTAILLPPAADVRWLVP